MKSYFHIKMGGGRNGRNKQIHTAKSTFPSQIRGDLFKSSFGSLLSVLRRYSCGQLNPLVFSLLTVILFGFSLKFSDAISERVLLFEERNSEQVSSCSCIV